MEQRYSIKRSGSVFWQCGLTMADVQSRLRSGVITPQWLICEVGCAGQAVTIAQIDQLRAENKRTEGESRSQTKGSEQKKEGAHQNSRTVQFKCIDCGAVLRIRLELSRQGYRCPGCKTEYRTLEALGEPQVLLVVPASRHAKEDASQSKGRKRAVTPEVAAALAVLGLDSGAAFDDVRDAYRTQVKSYHPDMVNHLGPELRQVAEKKTKEINAAYQVLERYYDTECSN